MPSLSPLAYMLMSPSIARDKHFCISGCGMNWPVCSIFSNSVCPCDMLLGSLSSKHCCTASAQLTGMPCVVQQACQRGELHASLKAFRQSVNKKVYKAHQEPKEKRKAAKTSKGGEVSPVPSWVSFCMLLMHKLGNTKQ